MTAEFHRRSRELFDAAMELPEAEREAYVASRSDLDSAIRDNVLGLIKVHRQNQDHRTRQPLATMLDAVVAAEAEDRPKRIGRYELFELIGEGGMGRVYRARRSDGIGQWLALKLIRKEFLSPLMQERFKNEREILSRLNHPAIAHFVDADSADDDTHFVAMELVTGLPLREYVQQHHLDLPARLRLFRQLLGAMAHAHRSLVIHRDIKPENVLVSADGMVKLLDFGIAKLLDHGPGHHQTQERVFTPLNAAPEQILGQPCDATTDVYALGALLYELVAGTPVFAVQGVTPGELEAMVLKVPPAPMRWRAAPPGCPPSEIPADLENIVQKALRKEPDGRYGSVEQFDADIARLLAHQPVSVSGNSLWYRTKKLIARHRLASALGMLLMVAAVVFFAMILTHNHQVTKERDRATLALNALRNAFLAADPDGFAGGDVSTRQILRQTYAALAPLNAKPDAQATALWLTLAEVQIAMGLLSDADRSLQAIEATDQVPPAAACVLRARVLAETEQLAAAMDLLATCDIELPSDAVQAELVRARVALKRDDFDEAARRFEALTLSVPSEQPVWILAAVQRAQALTGLGLHDQAMAGLDRAEQVAMQALGDDHPVRARLRLARLETLSTAGEADQLLAIGPSISAELQKTFGTDSILVGRTESLVGQTLLQHRHHEQAEPHLRNAWQAFRNSLGSNHLIALRAELNLAMALAGASGKASAAGPHFANVEKASRDRSVDAFHGYTAILYARWLALQGQPELTLQSLETLNAVPAGVLDAHNEGDLRKWQIYSYWAADCAFANGDYDRDNLCRLEPIDRSICREAKRQLC